MAGQGYTVGNFDEIKKIINLVDDKTRVGVCIDSCHVFAAGKFLFPRFSAVVVTIAF